MKTSRKDLSPAYAWHLARLTRPFPNFDVAFVAPLRRKAVQLLGLKEGARVLDVGCGIGGSFPFLVDAVGAAGEVVGVEISPEAAINARQRIASNRWPNVRVIESAAQSARLTDQFDGLLMLAAPDVYGSQEALENLFSHLRDHARVVLFGAKISGTRVGKLLNPLFRLALARLSFPTTPVPDSQPWRLVAQRVERLEIEDYFFGTMFLAAGSYVGK